MEAGMLPLPYDVCKYTAIGHNILCGTSKFILAVPAQELSTSIWGQAGIPLQLTDFREVRDASTTRFHPSNRENLWWYGIWRLVAWVLHYQCLSLSSSRHSFEDPRRISGAVAKQALAFLRHSKVADCCCLVPKVNMLTFVETKFGKISSNTVLNTFHP